MNEEHERTDTGHWTKYKEDKEKYVQEKRKEGSQTTWKWYEKYQKKKKRGDMGKKAAK